MESTDSRPRHGKVQISMIANVPKQVNAFCMGISFALMRDMLHHGVNSKSYVYVQFKHEGSYLILKSMYSMIILRHDSELKESYY